MLQRILIIFLRLEGCTIALNLSEITIQKPNLLRNDRNDLSRVHNNV